MSKNIAVFMHNLLNKGPIVNDLIRLHKILVIKKNFLKELNNLLVLLSFPETEYRIIMILKRAIEIANVLRIK